MTMMPMPDMNIGQIPTTQFNIPAPKKRGGMFGGGSALRAIAGIIGDTLLSRNGHSPVYLPMLMQRQQMRQEDQRYQRQRSDSMADWMAKQEYEATNRPPSEIERLAAMAGIQPGTPEFSAAMQQAFQNKINPFTQMRVQNPDGSETLQFVRPPQVPTAPVGGLIPIEEDEGGPSLLGSGGFPRKR